MNEKVQIKTSVIDVASVRTSHYGRLRFKDVSESDALELYAKQVGVTLERLKELSPLVTFEKVNRPCLVKSESKTLPDFSKTSQKQPKNQNANK